MNLGIAVYHKKDYPEILNLSEDTESMNETWEEWKEKKKMMVENLKNMGLEPIDILVTPRELVAYCRERGLPINGDSRANYVQFLVSKLAE